MNNYLSKTTGSIINQIAIINRKTADGVYSTELTMNDGQVIYIHVLPASMIYVDKFDWPELSEQIIQSDYEPIEAYDLSDGCSYYLSSKFAEAISDSLLYIIANK